MRIYERISDTIRWALLKVRAAQLKTEQIFLLPDLVSLSLVGRPVKRYTIVEIGVFKGDNAVALINRIRRRGVDVHYVGFDLFENQEEFFLKHPEERQSYDHPDWPYWEFQSGEHAFARVFAKIAAVLPEDRFILVPGDSNQSVRTNLALINNADLVFIDGCHDYEIVRADWDNVVGLFKDNPSLIVAFDDATYPGVSRVRKEIEELENKRVRVLDLNFNQFFVCSVRMPLKQRAVVEALALLARTWPGELKSVRMP